MNPKRLPSGLDGVVLVCAKCTKKLRGGFGKKGRTPLAKAIKKAVGKELRVMPVKCMGICPGGAVTMVDARRPGEYLLVKAGTPVDEVLTALA